MFEYQNMAKYYDLFYKNKSYEKEVDFLKNLIGNRKTILDVGCGTGIHMNLLENQYKVDGLDLSYQMLEIAKSRVIGKLMQGNLLNYETYKKYDAIISMFAVFNHLRNYDEFEQGILHWYNNLNENGILIVDIHNGRTSGKKESNYEQCKRIMEWTFNAEKSIETTNITYIINNKVYKDKHIFIIYEIDKIKDILNKNNLKYQLYENYSMNNANYNSKNMEIVIYK